MGDSSYLLNFDQAVKTTVITPVEERLFPSQQQEQEQEQQLELAPNLPNGVQPLTYQDSLEVARLQALAYTNQSLQESLPAMTNYLIAKDINNAAKDRPNLAFKTVDNNGKMTAYLLAYQGTLDGTQDTSPVIYIEDFASDPQIKSGLSLLSAFSDQYGEQYLQKGHLTPIITEARESTSYRLIKASLDRQGRKHGLTFEMEERAVENRSGESFHHVIIHPRPQPTHNSKTSSNGWVSRRAKSPF